MKFSLALAAMLLSWNSFAQNYVQKQRQVVAKSSIQSVYNIEFELKDYVFENGDSTLLESIIFELLPAQREQSVDVEVFYPEINQTIILYSYDKMEIKSMGQSIEY